MTNRQLNMASAIACFAGQITVRDRTTSLVRGRAQEVFTEPYQISASVQPIGGEDLQILGEGWTAEGSVMIWTRHRLFTGGMNPANQGQNSFITFDDEQWIVLRKMNWYDTGGFYTYAAQRYVI